MRLRAAAPALTAVVVAASFSTGCGGDSPDPRDLADLTAVYQLTSTIDSNTCDEPLSGGTEELVLIQCGTQVSVISPAGLWGNGSVQGDALSLSGLETQTDNAGCRSTQQSSGTLSGTADRLTIQRLKKKKLGLKDIIARIEDRLTPDIIA